MQELLSPLDDGLGIDFSKDVGKGMDELMALDYSDHRLFVVPYYVIGTCFVEDKGLQKQLPGPIWSTTKRAEYRVSKNLMLSIINTSQAISGGDTPHHLTIWLEYTMEE